MKLSVDNFWSDSKYLMSKSKELPLIDNYLNLKINSKRILKPQGVELNTDFEFKFSCQSFNTTCVEKSVTVLKHWLLKF